MASQTEGSGRIPRLDVGNYHFWRRVVRAAMIEKDYWPAIENFLREKPVPLTTAQAEANIKEKAAALLERNVSPSLMFLIKEGEDPHLSWLRIERHFEVKSEAAAVRLRTQLHELKLEKNEGVANYFARAEKLRDLLARAGKEVTDEELRVCLLVGLPKTPVFALVMQAMQANPDKSLDTLRESLQLLHVTEKSGEQRGDAYAAGDGRKCWLCDKVGHVQSKCPLKNQMKCSYCGKPGHKEDRCFLKRRASEQSELGGVSIAY